MKNVFLICLLLSGSIIAQSFKQDYRVEQNIKGGAKEIGEYNFVEYSVKSNDGAELYQIIDKVDYDIPYSKLEVFEDGSSVLISSFYGTLTFISNDGTETKNVKISDEIKVDYERSILSVVDKENVVILIDEQNGKISSIMKYRNNGVFEREIRIPIANVNGIAYSTKLNQIYISHIKWKNSGELNKRVTLMNSSGEVTKSFEASFEKGFFTDDNQFIGVSNKSIFSISTTELELKYEVKADTNSIFIDITEENNSIVLIQTKNPKLENGEWRYKNPTIKRIDSSGSIIKQTKYEVEDFSKYKFNRSQNNLEFITDNEKIVIE